MRSNLPETAGKAGHTLRIAAYSWGVADPLIAGLENEPGVHLHRAPPAECARLLLSKEVEMALVPSVATFLHTRWRWIEGWGVASDDRIRLARIVCQCPIEKIRALRLSKDSPAENAVAEIICWFRQLDSPPSILAADAPSSGRDEGRVVIGEIESGGECDDLFTYDIASEWSRLTGLPLVLACFCAREHPSAVHVTLLRSARRRGIQRLKARPRTVEKDRSLAESVLRETPEANLRYDLTERDERGWRVLGHFFQALCQASSTDLQVMLGGDSSGQDLAPVLRQ